MFENVLWKRGPYRNSNFVQNCELEDNQKIRKRLTPGRYPVQKICPSKKTGSMR